jgi:NADH-quinone oxidoreductase subunit J
MVGAIVLTHRRRKDTKPQRISRQVRRRPGDAIRNMQPGTGEGMKL